MAKLISPGVVVSVIDESFYTPAAPSTVPLIIIATQENKPNGANTGIAPGTLKANSGLAYLVTSQRDLAEQFGIPVFKTDANNNPIHAGEQNEYGLQAAYSLLGVSNRAYVVRADIDLGSINAKASAPQAEPINGTHWLNTARSDWGVFEWNGAAKGQGKGQTFTKKEVLRITNPNKVDNNGAPKTSVGAIGSYAIVSLMNLDTTYDGDDVLFYKTPGNSQVDAGTWVEVGSYDWATSVPAAVSTLSSFSFTSINVDLDGVTTTLNNSGGIAGIAGQINSASTTILADEVNGRLCLFALNGSFTLAGQSSLLGINPNVYYAPDLAVQPHTQVPEFKLSDTYPRPTGSVWVKTTEPNGGAKFYMSKYNTDSDKFDALTVGLFPDNEEAIWQLDKTGGLRIPVGAVYCKATAGSFRFYRKRAAGPTTITSSKISSLGLGTRTFEVSETLAGSRVLAASKIVTLSLLNNSSDADRIAGAINSVGLVNVVAEVDAQNRVVVRHMLGGDVLLEDTNGSLIEDIFLPSTNPNLYSLGGNQFSMTLWEPLRFTASPTAPTSLTKDKTLWYSSITDEVDIMVHDGSNWVGYQMVFGGTDAKGPQVTPTAPITQSDGTSPLVDGDLWVNTGDLDNYPALYRFDDSKTGPIPTKWTLVDKTNQSDEDGILFADARWAINGMEKDASTIEDLLQSDFVDPDCPDPNLYPKGMLLWNMRRSGFNVKEFRQNYIDIYESNPRYETLQGGVMLPEPMDDYYPHRWVTVSGNAQDGSGNFGRLAQRRVVVQSLQAVTNSSRDIREEARVFNIMACPGYPELIGEMISLNFDRGLSAFIVGDTPSRLTPDATSLKNWGDNLRLSIEDNDLGAASYDEYMAMFYPWGFTSDNFGRNIVVPPSHMMLRTIALSDSVSFPWFPPAGTRRGGINNASSVGYIDKEGEFVTVALNSGARDTLYEVKINPITFFTGVGLVNYGQKTRAKAASALNRINVARLIVYLRRQLDILAKPYIFEPNDKITRDEIKGAIESLMLELVAQRAIYDYIVVCDESNNTPDRIDKNELYVDVAIEPVKAVEFIYIPLRLKNTGEIGNL